MSEKRVTVWVCRFNDRRALMLQWIDPLSGRTKSRSARTADPAEAERRRIELEVELAHGLYQQASQLTWQDFRELFETEYLDARRPNTRLSYRATFDALEEVCNPARLRNVSDRMVSQFAAGLRKRETRFGEGNQDSTVKLRLQNLRTCLRWAVRQKMIPSCPAFPVIKLLKKKPQPIPLESFEKMVAKAPDAHMKTFLLCGWLAGLRLSESLALEREPTDTAPYLDLAGDRIVLPAEFVKAGEDQWIAVSPALREALLALPNEGPKFFSFRAKNGHEVTTSTVSRRVSALAAKAGVRLTMHSLRKGFGCRYAAKVPAQVLQRLLRHANIAMTVNYYTNVDDAAREAILASEAKVSGRYPNSVPNSTDSGEKAGVQNSLPQEGL
jgi:integrase